MQTLVHADIFFFISTICLVVLSILLAIGLYYALGILRDVRKVAARLEKASVNLEKDFDALRESVKGEGRKVKGMADLIIGFAMNALRPKLKKRKRAVGAEEVPVSDNQE